MKHLHPDQIEQLAGGGDVDVAVRRHASECARCRDDVEALRALVQALRELPGRAPSAAFADAVMRRVDLPAPWLERLLSSLPQVAPSPGFAAAVLERVDLPVPWLERALRALPVPEPSPDFAGAVMARVRLPVPWHERLWRFARQRRVALAAATASLVAATGAGSAWLFGARGVTLAEIGSLALGGLRDAAVSGLLALGRFGYELGLLDAGTSIADRIDPVTALGGLGLAGLVGLLSLWTMMRLSRPTEHFRLQKAA